MVRMVLSAHRGNHARTFPHSGYLGLTPVTLQGSLKLELEEDNVPLDASSIEIRVRCYESESRSATPGSRPSSVRTLYEVSETLWKVSDTPDSSRRLWAPMGSFKKDWRLVIPKDAQGALSTMSFKSWRVWWAVEGIVYHKPAGMFGNRLLKSFPVNLVQHQLPLDNGPSTSQYFHAPLDLHCSTSLNQSTFGPTDEFSLKLALSSTSNPTLRIKKVTIDVRRELCIYARSSDSSPRTPPEDRVALATPDCYPEFYPPLIRQTTESSDSDESMKDLMLKNTLDITPKSAPLLVAPKSTGTDFSYFSIEAQPAAPQVKSRRDDISLLTMTKSDESDLRKPWSSTFNGKLPKPNSLYRYAIGETCDTGNMYIRHHVTVKVHCKSSRGSCIVDLPIQDITMVAVSSSERQVAVDKSGRVLLYQAAEEKAFKMGRMTRRTISADNGLHALLSSGVEDLAQDPSVRASRRSSTALDMLAPTTPPRISSRRTSSPSVPLIPRRASNVHADSDMSSDEDCISAKSFLMEGRKASCSSISTPPSSCPLISPRTSSTSSTAPAFTSINFSNFSLANSVSSSSSMTPLFPPAPHKAARHSRRELGPKDVERPRRSFVPSFDPMSTDPNRIPSLTPIHNHDLNRRRGSAYT